MLLDFYDLSLQTNDQTHSLKLEGIAKFEDGSGYTCEIVVHSRGFDCKCPFYFNDFNLENAIENLEKMHKTLQDEAILCEEYKESEVKFVVNSKGHVFVSGIIVEYSEQSQRLEFGFRTDQTVLMSLVEDLRKIKELEPMPLTEIKRGRG